MKTMTKEQFVERTVLSKKNCHRAAIVRRIDDPDLGDYQFEWRGERINDNIMCPEFCHLARNPRWNVLSRIYDTNEDLENWEVVAWKYEVNFEDLWDVAYRAFHGTSFSPEERASQYIRGYEEALLDDLKQIPETEQSQYIAKFRDWVRTLFDKHSRIMSAMISGPANFPTRRNRKANNSYESAAAEFQSWRERVQKAAARRIEAAKPQEQRIAEAWESIKEDIDRFVDWNLCSTNLYNRLETIARKGEVELMQQTIDYVRELNKGRKRPIYTERHKFFKLAELATAVRQRQGATAEKGE